MQHILVISDNPLLCRKFSKIIEDEIYADFIFEFACSTFSKSVDFSPINIKPLDLNNSLTIHSIIEKYTKVFSIHCKQIFPSKLVNGVKCINVHPGYNPINRGWYPQVFSIIYDLPVGATIHEIDEQLDHGGIIAREYVEKYNDDTSETLYNRILEKEVELLDRFLQNILNDNYRLIHPESEGNLFLKKDFNNLLEIDLNQNYLVSDLINKLRALTHGKFKNAYFIDKETGDKIFIGIQLERETNG